MSRSAFDGTRRRFLGDGVVLGTGAILIGLMESLATSVAADNGNAGVSVHEEVDLGAPPPRIYEAFLDDRQFSAFNGAPAQISSEAGGAFNLFGGRVTGRVVELISNQRIVLAWHPVAWWPGVFSIVRLELIALDAGTRVVLDQTSIPPEKLQAQIDNWPNHVWGPLRKYLGA
jgi:activator of HSP90 ATPase